MVKIHDYNKADRLIDPRPNELVLWGRTLYRLVAEDGRRGLRLYFVREISEREIETGSLTPQ